MKRDYQGISRSSEIGIGKRRKQTQPLMRRIKAALETGDGIIAGLFALPVIAMLMIKIPFSGELMLLVAWLVKRRWVMLLGRGFDFPYRVPMQADVGDGSIPKEKNKKTGEMEWKKGTGLTYLAQDTETNEPVYSGDSDLRTHMLVLGTTGSGKPQPLHANVMTPTGWRTMGSLRVGDVVCTPDGKTAPILRVFEKGVQEVFRIRLRDGRKAEGTADHLWRVIVQQPDGSEAVETATTERIAQLLDAKVRVLVPVVKRKLHGAGAKLHRWARIWKIESIGEHACRCIEIDHPQHLYVTDDNIVTHNTEFLLGLVFNALVQNTGCIYVDGKGDPKLIKEIFRLARYLGREDDLLVINFIRSGRDFVEKQFDKVTNNLNLMAGTSSGMLIELIVSMMDDSGGGGDMWKGRAISFVAALTRPLVYLRDKGFINLSPEKYLEHFELSVIEDMVWEHNGQYGDMFDVIVAPLRSYLTTLPGYSKAKLKKQEQKTLEQHGFIVMQLTRIFNDLTFNYGHIFKTKVGDCDFFDIVINRRILVVLLPALENAPDSLRMLGKLIVGSIKQMMAGCLGNRVEGVIREIIDSRPTNAPVPFYCILDEYGYYAVVGFAVAPAQARSLGFAVVFAAQDFSSLKKSSAEEADATWENTNVRAVGRLTSGEESETWRRIVGAASKATQAVMTGVQRSMGALDERFKQQDNVSYNHDQRLIYDDLAMQENGEFTLLIGKKEEGGKSGGVRVIRSMGFYTAGASPKEMRINDLLPVESPEPADLPQQKKAVEAMIRSFIDGSFATQVKGCVKADATLFEMHRLFTKNYERKQPLHRKDVSFAVLGWFLNSADQAGSGPATSGSSGAQSATNVPQNSSSVPATPPATAPASAPVQAASQASPAQDSGTTQAEPQSAPSSPDFAQDSAAKAIMSVSNTILSTPKGEVKPYASSYTSAVPADDDSDREIGVNTADVTDLLNATTNDSSYPERAKQLLSNFQLTSDSFEDDYSMDDDLMIAERQRMLDAEMAAKGGAFNSMEELFDAEERIERVQREISETTQYPGPPTPEPRNVDQMRSSLSSVAEQLKQQVKDNLRSDR